MEIFSPGFATERCIWTLASALDHRYAAAIAADAVGAGRADLHCPEALVKEILAWERSGGGGTDV